MNDRNSGDQNARLIGTNPPLGIDDLAIAEHFAAAWEAGEQPQLAAYMRQYPRCASALSAVAARLLAGTSKSQASDVVTALSAGTMRALWQIDATLANDPAARAVAESTGQYATSSDVQAADVPSHIPRDELTTGD